MVTRARARFDARLGGLGGLLWLIALACTAPPPGLSVTGIDPPEITHDAPRAVTILGEGFRSKVKADFDDPAKSVVLDQFEAELRAGEIVVTLQEVTLIDEGHLSAIVPAGIAARAYDLHLTDPRERVATKAEALRVYALSCTRGDECRRGHCADGVCCDAACDGPCESCARPDAAGTCTTYPYGEDPDDECADDGQCVRSCDGAGACTPPACVSKGGACEDEAACSTGYCEHGVCCDQPCEGPCEACHLEGASGTCTPLAEGALPRTPCEAPPGCVAVCDGNDACVVRDCELGAPCEELGSEACASGRCVDGRCCDRACDGPCESCDLPGSPGLCQGHTALSDPEDDCPDPEGCHGVCDGAGGDGGGACVFMGCVAGAACDTGSWCASDRCVDGVCCGSVCGGPCQSCALSGHEGTCLPYPALTDPEEECDGPPGCEGVCDGLAGGGCVVVGCAPGHPCAEDASCASGHCADEVCCDGPCAGPCEACDTAARSGACVGYAEGSDPDDECPDPAGCLGVCDGAGGQGSGACHVVGCEAGAVCDAAESGACASGHCADGLCCDAPCDGFCQACDLVGSEGACVDIGPDLDPDQECADLGACVSHCDGDGACTQTCRPRGEACEEAASCVTGYCADGLCCEGACDGVCEACDRAGSLGLCVDHDAGEDPEGECPAPTGCAGVCDGDGACRVEACASGVACDPAEPGACASGHCVDGVCCEGACEGLCEACDLAGLVGQCAAIAAGEDPTDECSDLGACESACDGAFACDLACQAQGQACDDPAACATGHCVDGVCCDRACDGPCEACDVAGAEGSCVGFTAGDDPESECADPSGCDGVCDGLGGQGGGACVTRGCGEGVACAGLGAVVCDSGWCVDAVCCGGPCDGLCETCASADAPGACIGHAYDTDPDDECVDPAGCERVCAGDGGAGAGTCITRRCGDGVECAALGADGCASGACVDGVCCDGPCAGVCEACDLPGAPGACTGHAMATDPEDECADPSLCQGACDGAGGAGDGACVTVACQNGVDCQEAGADMCLSPHCVDEVCCDQACDGLCERCDATGQAGVCLSVTPGTDPEGDCPDPPLCDNLCDSQGACVVSGCQLGADCAALDPAVCDSGACVDGVCCDSPCGAFCHACDLTGQEGLCGPIPAEQDPDAECADLNACTSSCDGAGACDQLCACVRVVNPDAPAGGDGLTWGSAFTAIQPALDAARAVVLSEGGRCEVWVRAGRYHVYQMDKDDTIALQIGVNLLGGFAGTESASHQRDPVANPTILDGHAATDPLLRVGHVVTGADDVILDGFVITGGWGEGGDFKDAGSGLFLDGVSPAVIDCVFMENYAKGLGGAVHAVNGAKPSFAGCVFRVNGAYKQGGALAVKDSAEVSVDDCTFFHNEASDGGGALYVEAATLSISDSRLLRNGSDGPGGLAYVKDGEISFDACVLALNQSAKEGGALYLDKGTLTLLATVIMANQATKRGGAIFAKESSIGVGRAFLLGNRSSDEDGGALYLDAKVMGEVWSSVLAGNDALERGGAIHDKASDGNVDYMNLTLVANTAGLAGGGLFLQGSNTPSRAIRNAVFWDNHAPSTTQIHEEDGQANIRYSVVMGGYPGATAVTGDDPAFEGWPAASGVWKQIAYDAERHLTILTIATASWTPGALQGMLLWPNQLDSRWLHVHDNTANSVLVWGDVLSMVSAGDAWSLYDLEPGDGSPCLDAGTGNVAPDLDVLGRPRVDLPAVPDAGVGQPPYVDRGAYERQGTSGTVGP